MDQVRLGVIGCGGMGSSHLGYLNSVANLSVTAICDIDPAKVEKYSKQCEVPGYSNHRDLLNSGKCNAVLIATPHYDHPIITRDAFAKGLHVLCEKPIAVDVKEARTTNELYKAKYSHLKFGVMFQQRTSPVWRKIRDLIAEGELGKLFRMTWIATDWFRTWTYYASGGWRATWAGEGGGVMINQCPHNMDQIQWLLGGMMPQRVTAVASIAKRHPIEVEDEMNAILEYSNGMIGHFITTTGEGAGTNRLEFAGDRGRLVAENGKITFYRTRKSVLEVLEKSPESFAHVERWECNVPPYSGQEAHRIVTEAFVGAVLKGTPLIAEGVDGVKGLEIGNAMMLAGLTRQPVELPVDGDVYQKFLKDMAAKYGGKKTLQKREAIVDMNASFK
jgi:predicted dehydrogenase